MLRTHLDASEKQVLRFARQLGWSEAEALLRDELRRRQQPRDERDDGRGARHRALPPAAEQPQGYITK